MAVRGSYGRTGPYRTYYPPHPVRGSYGPGTGGATRTYRPWAAGAAPAPAGAGATGSPNLAGPYAGLNLPPLPSGQYNPEHDILARKSEQGLGFAESDINTGEARDTTDYWTRLSRLRQAGTDENADYLRAKERLGQAFTNLGTRQQEQQNAAGVLGGGAVLAAAQRRAFNQGQQQEGADIGHQRNVRSNEQSIADLAEQLEPRTATSEGGRAFQDLQTKRERAREEDVTERKGQHDIASFEATERGWRGVPAMKPAPAPAAGKGAALVTARKRVRGSYGPGTGGARRTYRAYT